jgi:hypothetical protein
VKIQFKASKSESFQGFHHKGRQGHKGTAKEHKPQSNRTQAWPEACLSPFAEWQTETLRFPSLVLCILSDLRAEASVLGSYGDFAIATKAGRSRRSLST